MIKYKELFLLVKTISGDQDLKNDGVSGCDNVVHIISSEREITTTTTASVSLLLLPLSTRDHPYLLSR